LKTVQVTCKLCKNLRIRENSINARKNTRTKHNANMSDQNTTTANSKQSATITVKGKYTARQSSEVDAAAPVDGTQHGHSNEQNSVQCI